MQRCKDTWQGKFYLNYQTLITANCTDTTFTLFLFCSYPSQASVQVQYVPYLDSLAQEVGVRPNLLSLFFRDPGLWVKILLGPCTPYQYRLCGPGQWMGAREAICTQWDRVTQPMRTRPVPKLSPSPAPGWWLPLSGGLLVVLTGLALRIKLSDLLDTLYEATDGLGGLLDDLWKDGPVPVV